MNVSELTTLFADRVEVRHGGHTFALRAPSLADATAVQARFAEAAKKLPEGADGRVPYMRALAEAVELTLEVEDGDLPEGIGQRIILGTGGIVSPVGKAAARLCGLHVVGDAEAPDADLPT